jgi:hypothetical protein
MTATQVLINAASIEKVLNLNQAAQQNADSQNDPSSTIGLSTKSTPILNADGEPIWKVLVFDNLGRDVISSVLRVSDLRAWGVTIHLYVKQNVGLHLPKPTKMLSPAAELLLTAQCQTNRFKTCSYT